MNNPEGWIPPENEVLASCRVGSVLVEVEYIGEGMSGEYDSRDPDDAPLVRLNAIDESDQERDTQDNTLCTMVPAYAPQATLDEFAHLVAADLMEMGSWGQRLECWSWTSVDEQGNLIIPKTLLSQNSST